MAWSWTIGIVGRGVSRPRYMSCLYLGWYEEIRADTAYPMVVITWEPALLRPGIAVHLQATKSYEWSVSLACLMEGSSRCGIRLVSLRNIGLFSWIYNRIPRFLSISGNG